MQDIGQIYIISFTLPAFVCHWFNILSLTDFCTDKWYE